MRKTFWLWFCGGAGAAIAMLATHLIGGDLTGLFLLFLLIALASLFTAIATNFGKGYWTQAGWSHTWQRPWNIPPVPRPRLGGFATGFSAVVTIIYLAFVVYMSTRG